MTPSFKGRIAVIEPGVLPSISLATSPTALPFWRTRLVPFFTATTLGSFSTMPSPLTHTSVLQVPRSMPMSMLNIPSKPSKITLPLLEASPRSAFTSAKADGATTRLRGNARRGDAPRAATRPPGRARRGRTDAWWDLRPAPFGGRRIAGERITPPAHPKAGEIKSYNLQNETQPSLARPASSSMPEGPHDQSKPAALAWQRRRVQARRRGRKWQRRRILREFSDQCDAVGRFEMRKGPGVSRRAGPHFTHPRTHTPWTHTPRHTPPTASAIDAAPAGGTPARRSTPERTAAGPPRVPPAWRP